MTATPHRVISSMRMHVELRPMWGFCHVKLLLSVYSGISSQNNVNQSSHQLKVVEQVPDHAITRAFLLLTAVLEKLGRSAQ